MAGNETTPAKAYVICDECGEQHVAEYSHEGQWGSHEHIYAVVCTRDNLTDYYTSQHETFTFFGTTDQHHTPKTETR